MWKDSNRNVVEIFQPNILRIVGFYVRHSAHILCYKRSNCKLLIVGITVPFITVFHPTGYSHLYVPKFFCAEMSRCRNVPVPKRPYAKLPHTTKTLCRKVFKQKCPQRQNIYLPECPWNRKVPIAKLFCDDLSVPKFLLPKCQEPKFLDTDELKPQAYIMTKKELMCFSLLVFIVHGKC